MDESRHAIVPTALGELTLTAEEVAAIDALDREDGRGGTDPASK